MGIFGIILSIEKIFEYKKSKWLTNYSIDEFESYLKYKIKALLTLAYYGLEKLALFSQLMLFLDNNKMLV